MLAPEFLPVYGGIGNYVLEISRKMPRDVEVLIVAPRRPNSKDEIEDRSSMHEDMLPGNVNVTYIGQANDMFFHNISFQMNCSKALRNLVHAHGIDIVHSQSSMPDFLVSPSRLKVPIVTTIHTTVQGHIEAIRSSGEGFAQLKSSEKFVVLFGPALTFLENRYYASGRHFLTVSEWARREIAREKRIDKSRIRVVYIGVDTEMFNPANRAEASRLYPQIADIDSPKILYLSRMATRKGILLLLRAIPKILQKVDAHFIFAGAGIAPEFPMDKRNYTYLGYVPRSVPPFLYSLSDMFVLPSLYENFPACILEAMASQCAVISTNICGIPEMISNGRSGVLIPPNDTDAIANSIIKLIDDEDLRKELAREARESAVRNFSWARAAQKTSEYYDEIIRNHGRGEKP